MKWSNKMHYIIYDSPISKLYIAGTHQEIHYITSHKEEIEGYILQENPLLLEAKRQLECYFAHQLTTFDLPVRITGTPFQRKCLEVLQTVPYGTTVSYGELSNMMHYPKASRAVGNALHRNPILIVIPCHRVIKGNGKLGGFGSGSDMKLYLLNHEGGYHDA